jgi:hypothetical protein
MFPHPEEKEAEAFDRRKAAAYREQRIKKDAEQKKELDKVLGREQWAVPTGEVGRRQSGFKMLGPDYTGGVFPPGDYEASEIQEKLQRNANISNSQLKQIIDEVYKALLQEGDSQEGAPVPKKKTKR